MVAPGAHHGSDSLCGLALVALGTTGCFGYHAEPLPALPVASAERPLDASRLRLATDELHRPARPPVPIDLSDGIGPDEAALLAVLLNPDLIAARAAHGEGLAQVLIGGILPNPVLGVSAQQPFGPVSAGTNVLTNVSLAIDVKPYVARSARRRAATAALVQIDFGIAWQEWRVAQEARLLVVRLGWLRKRIGVARAELDFAEQTARAMTAAIRAGDATLGQIGVQRATVESVRRVLDQLQQSELETDAALRALLGNPQLERLEVTEPTVSVDASGASSGVDACLEGRLDLAALRHGYQAGEEQLRAAVLDQFPAMNVGIAYQHNEVALDFIGGVVNLELPLFNHNQGAIALGGATRRRLRLEYDARVAAARGELDKLSRFSVLLASQLADVARSVGPLEEIEVKERAAVLRGDVDRLSYQIVRSALFDQRLQQAALAQALAEARIGLQTTCGGEPGSPR